MPWYKTGTVNVTNDSNSVIGTGTTFISSSRVGDAFKGPDGGWYEVINIASDTAMAISPNYQGVTNTSGSYAIAPMQGYVKDSADALRSLVNQYGATLGVFGESGTQSGIRASLNLTNTDGLPEGTSNKYFTDARVRTALLTGLVTTDGTPVAETDNVIVGFGKIQKQLNTQSTTFLPLSGGKMVGSLNEATIVSLSSAATVDIGAAASNIVTISGTTTITSLGTISSGARRTVRFLGSLTLTHNGASLILPTAANIVTAANDNAEFVSLGSGNWFCLRYTMANGKAISFAYDRSNIVGTVSQASGIPTGSVIETGTNTNGTYIKWADGTMICLKTMGFGGGTVANGTVFRSLSVDMGSYAVAFVGAVPIVLANGLATATGGGWAGQQTFNTLTGFGNWSVYTSAAVTGNLQITLTATGRWF